MGRLLITLLSLAILAGAGWASWTGVGVASRDTGATSIRTGSAGVGGVGRIRVK
ncbi:hypothetical protein [Jannaschia ovalis]|uniref:Uncharacterized protein n=1 Tax=Jannaschia ovalis TaxID=3038773 RepID=A0ABY8LCQ4_9RHOB|nr:hypothetical protein [Jannaschia sp. GRR-S6-38]WGH79105.1 hypothetical protein P8627_02250 [Jannaschia sp. GRR-S6-38]